MDFSRFDTAGVADEARPLHLTCAATGRPLYANEEDPFTDNGKPCRVFVRGGESAQVRKGIRDIERAMAKADAAKADEKTIDDLHRQMVMAAKVKIEKFENVNRGNDLAGEGDLDWFLNLNKFQPGSEHPSFAEQVHKFSAEREHWLGNGSTS